MPSMSVSYLLQPGIRHFSACIIPIVPGILQNSPYANLGYTIPKLSRISLVDGVQPCVPPLVLMKRFVTLTLILTDVRQKR